MKILELHCPACAGSLDRAAGELRCHECARMYPILFGIPDLRLRSDAYLSLDEDRAKAAELAALDREDFAGLVRAYWSRTPEVPHELAGRYATAVLEGHRRATSLLDAAGIHDLRGQTLLDVGTGTGGMLTAAAARGATAVGVDIALRWLVIAKRQLSEAGVDATLVAADAMLIPFAPASFDVTTCIETLEHTDRQEEMLRACLTSTVPGGRCLIVTANRFSLAPDPVVHLWGIGYLPRSVATAYVRRRRRTRYQHYRPLSARTLRRAVRHEPGASVKAGPIPLSGKTGGVRGVVVSAYERVRRSRVGAPLATVAPFLQVSLGLNGSRRR